MMNNNRIRCIGAAVLVCIWLVLTAFAWFSPANEISDAERRPLAQWPGISGETLFDGSFMSDFESYTLDQFPLRDTFRQLKSLFHYYVMNQGDNNDIYIADGYAAVLDYPMNRESVVFAADKFNTLYELYLKDTGSTVFMSVVPDKGYYLAEENGYLSMDYEAMFALLREKMPWATHVDITGCLDVEDYYFTDTHWRQESILDVAQTLCSAMGVTGPSADDFTPTRVEKPFYGVYYGQAALPMASETMYVMNSDLLDGCTVYNYETDKTTHVYDMEKLNAKDMYDIYLSGSQSLLRIDNPNAGTDRELIVFRDSFGSSLVPLMVGDYKTVTVVDIRYINSQLLGRFIDFHGQDVLFTYSTLVLNSSSMLK